MAFTSPEPEEKKCAIVALGAILVVAATLRLYGLPQQGFIVFDEGAYVVEAKILEAKSYSHELGTSFRPGFNILVIFASLIVSWSPLTGAGVSAVLGILTMVAVYGVARQLFTSRAALVATALLATSTYHVFYSRVGLSNGAAVFFFTLGLYCWLRFCADRTRLLFFPFAAGLSFGYAFTCHYSLMLYVALCVAVDLWQAIRAKAYRGTIMVLGGIGLPVVGFYPFGEWRVWRELLRLDQTVQLNPASPLYFLELLWRHETLLLTLFLLAVVMRAVQKVRHGRVGHDGHLYAISVLGLIVLSVQAARGAAAPRLMAPVLPLMAVLAGGAVTSIMDSSRVQRGRTLLWGSLVVLILMAGVVSNRGVFAWQSRFEDAAQWLRTRYPTSLYTCESWWPICRFYQLGKEVHALQEVNAQVPPPEFLFTNGSMAAGRLVAAFDNPIEQHPLVVEENGPGSIQSGGSQQIPRVIRIYDLRPEPRPSPDRTPLSLLDAAERGDAATISALLDQGADVNARTAATRATALMVAAAKGHTAIAEALLAHGADVNTGTHTSGTALMGAAASGHLPIVHTLLAYGADVNARDINGGTALMGAAVSGHLAVVHALLAAGADASTQYVNGKTAFLLAQERGHTLIAQALQRAEVRSPQRPGEARKFPEHLTLPDPEALFQSAQRGDIQAVEALLAGGVDPNARSKTGETALMWAAVNGSLPVVHTLLVHHADVNARQANGWTALMGAAEQGYSAIVKALLERGADVNLRQVDGVTAFVLAAAHGHLTATQLLLASGAEVNIRTRTGLTALMWAAGNGHLPVVQALLAQRAEVDVQDYIGTTAPPMLAAGPGQPPIGTTALMWAAASGHLPVVQVLLAAGAKVNSKRADGVTALMRAAANGHPAVVHALLAAGADANARTQGGATALMVAVVDGHTAIVEALLAHGAEVNVHQVNGWTALRLAEERGHTTVMELLEKAGAKG